MKRVLLIVALSACIWPSGAFAGDRSPDDSKKHPGRTEAVAQSADAPGAKSKAFIHPETGEILTREQWQDLGIENNEAAAARSSSDAPETENTPTVLQGRQIDLGNGDYVIVVDTPDSERIETKAWFDEEGKAHIKCNH